MPAGSLTPVRYIGFAFIRAVGASVQWPLHRLVGLLRLRFRMGPGLNFRLNVTTQIDPIWKFYYET